MKELQSNNKLAFGVSQALKELTIALRKTVVYDLLRIHVYCNKQDNICLDFVATSDSGIYKYPVIEIDPLTKCMYYNSIGKGFKYTPKQEKAIVDASISAVGKIAGLCDNLGDVYWEVPNSKHFIHQKGYAAINPANGELVLFLLVSESFSDTYIISESLSVCGRTLSGEWKTIATAIEEGYTSYREVV